MFVSIFTLMMLNDVVDTDFFFAFFLTSYQASVLWVTWGRKSKCINFFKERFDFVNIENLKFCSKIKHKNLFFSIAHKESVVLIKNTVLDKRYVWVLISLTFKFCCCFTVIDFLNELCDFINIRWIKYSKMLTLWLIQREDISVIRELNERLFTFYKFNLINYLCLKIVKFYEPQLSMLVMLFHFSCF